MADSSPTPATDDPELIAGTPSLKKRRARPYHRILGVITLLPLVWVMITGAALNHTVDWKLDQIHLSHPWILGAYGMIPSGEPAGLHVGPHEIAGWDGQVFRNAAPLETAGKLLGAVPDGGGMAVVTDSGVLRLDESGATVEFLDGVSLPAPPLEGVASENGKTLLKNAAGWHEVGENWLEFTRRDDARPVAQTLSPVADASSRNRLRRAWAHGGLPASRVLLDLHAGKFLGVFSRYLYDFVTLCTLWLCVTGVILFVRKPRRNR